MSELLILYLLLKSQNTMYSLSKSLQKDFGFITKPGFGTLQPALKRLEKKGCVKSDKFFTEGGKPYYYYSITDTGKEFLKKKLKEKPSLNPVQFYPSAKIKLSCSDILDNNERKELYGLLKSYMIKFKTEAEKTIKTDFAEKDICRKMVLDNTICEYKNLIMLTEGLEHACNR